jgi:multidrug efflux pump
MNLSAPFIRRPIATVLLTVGLALAGIGAFFVLPVAPLPQVDYPAISVSARLSGASPQTMASSVATPLERRLGVIAGINEITSNSSNGSTNVSLQFDLSKNIDSAAREVQAAINASRVDLPATLRSNPTYKKRNPADQPVMIVALTSKTKTPGQIYDAVSNVIQQRLSQVDGVGEVELGGGSLPAVRVEIAPFALNRYGISLEDVRAAIESANANRPKGTVEAAGQRMQIYTPVGGRTAADYKSLVIAWRNNAPVRLSDIATVVDSVSDVHTTGLFNGKPAIIVLVTQQPGANVIQTVNSVRAELPALKASLPADIEMQVASDSTNSIRSSLHEIEVTLAITVILVVLVVSAFLRSGRATIIPAVATIVSLLGTFGAMYLLKFSLNNLSLMALTVAAGFVVDDAIVVLENTSRHLEEGKNRFEAALLGAKEVGFTVLSMSISLVAVFIPLLFMGGQVGRLFREFAVTLSAAVLISLVISLTTTPMMCAWLLRREARDKPANRLSHWLKVGFDKSQASYEKSLDWALSAKPLMLLILAAVIVLNVYLYSAIPKGFFPQQDSGRLNGGLRADQSISSQEMGRKLLRLQTIVMADPAVATVVGFTGGGRGGGFMSVDLKPRSQRKESGAEVIARLRPKTAQISGVTLFLNPQQDVRMGGRSSNATYQYTLKSDNTADLKKWAQKLSDKLETVPILTDVNTDQQDNGVETFVDVDKDTASRMGVSMRDVDNALYNSFGQRQAATIYEDINQYSVVMEVEPQFNQGPEALTQVYVPASNPPSTAVVGLQAPKAEAANPALRDPSTGSALNTQGRFMIPLSTIARVYERPTPTSVNHQDTELATTVSFNLNDGTSLSDAPGRCQTGRGRHPHAVERARQLPGHGAQLPGNPEATADPDPRGDRRHLHRAGHALREHDPSDHRAFHLAVGGGRRGAGPADLQDGVFGHRPDRRLPADRPRQKERHPHHRLRAGGPAITRALGHGCGARGLYPSFPSDPDDHARRRPRRLPLAIGFGEGSELRRPLGVAIIGGLVASQLLTLLTTPVIYIYLDRLRGRKRNERHLAKHAGGEGEAQPA